MRRIKKDKRLFWYLGFVALLSLFSIFLDQIAIQIEIKIRENENILYKTSLLHRNISKYQNQLMVARNLLFTRYNDLNQNTSLPKDVKDKLYGSLLQTLSTTVVYMGQDEEALGKYYKELPEKFDKIKLYDYGKTETGGIGIEFEEKDGKIVVAGLFKNYPAEKANVKVGDHIIHVNSEQVQDTWHFINLITGEVGTKVTITIVREGKYSDPITKHITREVVSVDSLGLSTDRYSTEELDIINKKRKTYFNQNAIVNLPKMLEIAQFFEKSFITRKLEVMNRLTKEDKDVEKYEKNRQAILIYGMLSQILSLFFLLLFFKRLFSYTLVKMK